MRGDPSGDTASSGCVRILDVFSGAGGLSLGWISSLPAGQAGVVAAIDSDASLEPVFAANFPGVRFVLHTFEADPNADQPRRVAEKVGCAPGDIDVLLAGPPCQTLSAAGKRLDHADNRLLLRVCDLAAFLRPRLLVIENVPRLKWVNDGRLLGRARVQLTEAGYATDVMAINATAFGLPQIRIRCFLVGALKGLVPLDLSRRDVLFPKPTHVAIGTPRPPEKEGRLPLPVDHLELPPTVGEAIDDLPPLKAGEGEEESPLDSAPTSAYQRLLRGDQDVVFNHVAANHSREMISALAGLNPGDTPQRVAGHPLRRKDYFRSAYARLDSSWVSSTMTTQTHNPGSGRFTHYRDNRVLTVREVARLQGFPDWFRFVGSPETQRRHVGNAVPPLLAAAIARNLFPLIR